MGFQDLSINTARSARNGGFQLAFHVIHVGRTSEARLPCFLGLFRSHHVLFRP